MSDGEFWALLDSTIDDADDRDEQVAALHEALDLLTPDEVVAFDSVFNKVLLLAYSWDLWGAAYVIMGGASDDGFEYFRSWLISKGRRFFQAALADPDGLADLIGSTASEVEYEFEDFMYVAGDVWSEKTGRPCEEMPYAPVANTASSTPSGTPFEEDPTYLAERYPRLSARF